jgi:hypothetical protein
MNGSIGTCMSEPCDQNSDCSGSTAVCNTIIQPHVCVQCLNDSDCTGANAGLVCDQSNHCVQCTTNQTNNCVNNPKGSVCLANETCGCAMDSDCGSPTSGMVCDGTMHTCVMGCRGSGGNGCPAGQTCSSSNNMPGTCSGSGSSSSSSGSASSSGSSGTSSGMGGAHSGDAGTGGIPAGDNVIAQAKGCGCVVAGDDDGGALLGLAGLLAAFGLTAGRRSSSRRRKA